MKRNLIGFIDTDNKRINYSSQREFERAMNDFGPGTKVNIIISKYRRKRSLGQNNLFHWYCDIIAKDIGYDFDEFKREMKSKYGVWEDMLDREGNPVVDEDTGETMRFLKSISDYDTLETSILIEGTIRTAVFLGIILPDPNDLRINNIM